MTVITIMQKKKKKKRRPHLPGIWESNIKVFCSPPPKDAAPRPLRLHEHTITLIPVTLWLIPQMRFRVLPKPRRTWWREKGRLGRGRRTLGRQYTPAECLLRQNCHSHNYLVTWGLQIMKSRSKHTVTAHSKEENIIIIIMLKLPRYIENELRSPKLGWKCKARWSLYYRQISLTQHPRKRQH